MNFRTWLLSSDDQGFEPLRVLARDSGWAEGQESPADLLGDLRQRARADDLARLEALLMSAWTAYQQAAARQMPAAAAQGALVGEGVPKRRNVIATFFGQHLGVIIIGLISLAVLAGMFWSIFVDPSFLTMLAKADVARGLITFFFAIGTIGVAIAVAFMVLTSDVKEIEGRFPLAKDVLTILIGVLGTVIGYYFGTARDEQVDEFEIAAPITAPDELTAGASFRILSSAQGGEGPYTYSVVFEDEGMTGVSRAEIESGLLINQAFTVPESFEREALPFEFRVRDRSGREKSFFQTLPVRQPGAGNDPEQTASTG